MLQREIIDYVSHTAATITITLQVLVLYYYGIIANAAIGTVSATS